VEGVQARGKCGAGFLLAAMIQQKVEIRFAKGEAIRFISHHDLMRAIMRAVRRANLPVRLTEGFNPRPRIVFPVALEAGVASLDEAAEIEFNQCIDPQEVFGRLSSVLPPGIQLKTVRELPPRRAGQIPLKLTYRLHLAEAGIAIQPQALRELMEQARLPFDRPRENHIQKVDLRPALERLSLEAAGDLVVEIKPRPEGSARPLEVLSLLTGMPLSELKQVLVTKLSMELAPPPEMTPEQLTERQLLLKRDAQARNPEDAVPDPM
jgi:radical SAM-linked protein